MFYTLSSPNRDFDVDVGVVNVSSFSSSSGSFFNSFRGKSLLAFADWSSAPTEATLNSSLDPAPRSFSLKRPKFLFRGLPTFPMFLDYILSKFFKNISGVLGEKNEILELLSWREF